MVEQEGSKPFARPLSSLNALTNRLAIVQDVTPSDLSGRTSPSYYLHIS